MLQTVCTSLWPFFPVVSSYFPVKYCNSMWERHETYFKNTQLISHYFIGSLNLPDLNSIEYVWDINTTLLKTALEWIWIDIPMQWFHYLVDCVMSYNCHYTGEERRLYNFLALQYIGGTVCCWYNYNALFIYTVMCQVIENSIKKNKDIQQKRISIFKTKYVHIFKLEKQMFWGWPHCNVGNECMSRSGCSPSC